MKIRYKLLLILLALASTTVLISGYIGYRQSKESLTETVQRQLTGVRRAKTRQVEAYFEMLTNHVRTLSEDRMFIDATDEFRAAFRKLDAPPVTPDMRGELEKYYRSDYLPALGRLVRLRPRSEDYLPIGRGATYLQLHYIVQNPLPPGRKMELDAAADDSEYTRVHAKYHRSFRKIVDSFGYYDMFLFAETGRAIYTVAKEPDFGTSMLIGPYKSTKLAEVVRRAQTTENTDAVFIADFEDYEPSLGAPAAFIASPIFDGIRRVGVLAFQLSNREFDKVTSGDRGWVRDGLGYSGDSGIVGPDYLLRSNARGFLENPEKHLAGMRARGIPEMDVEKVRAYNSTFLRQKVKLPSVEKALAGEEGTMIQKGSSGALSLVAYGPLNIPGLKWTLASRMDYAEALAPVDVLKRKLMIWTAVMLALAALLSLVVAGAIAKPVKALANAARRLGSGDLTASVPVESKDELGELSATFNGMVTNIREKTEIIAQKNRENEALLLNILPAPIAERLKGGESRIADNFAEVTVMFADIVGFTTMSGKADPSEIIDLLNNLFTRFDASAHRHGIEKIKTIGDAYMAVAGLPVPYPDHSRRMVEMALDMIDDCRNYSRENGREISIRIGVNSGPVVAGVVGSSKYIYDLWGDTVNVASRMESHGVPGNIQVTRPVYDQLRNEYDFEYRGEIDVKGKGKTETWLVRERVSVLA